MGDYLIEEVLVVLDRVRVLHVCEAYGGGVAAALHDYVAQTDEAVHLLAYAVRKEAPVPSSDLASFAECYPMPAGFLARMRLVRQLTAECAADVVHAHSSWAGVYSRIGLLLSRIPIVYTPHCYAFLRRDLGRPAAVWFWLVELLLSVRTTVYAACSPYEADLSRWFGLRRNVVYVPNVAPPRGGPTTPPEYAGSVRLLGVGRINAQKDPVFFARCVRAVRAAGIDVTADWVGDGHPAGTEILRSAGVAVLGWQDRSAVRSQYRKPGTVYLHCARWEGFPIGILEANAAQVPIIVRSSKVYRGLRLPRAVSESEEVVALVRETLHPAGRADSVADWNDALRENNAAVQAERLAEVYERARRRRAVPRRRAEQPGVLPAEPALIEHRSDEAAA